MTSFGEISQIYRNVSNFGHFDSTFGMILSLLWHILCLLEKLLLLNKWSSHVVTLTVVWIFTRDTQTSYYLLTCLIIKLKSSITVKLLQQIPFRLVHTDHVKRSRIGQFLCTVNRGQLENSLSYCINACVLPGLNEPLLKLKVTINILFQTKTSSIKR